MRHNRDLDRLRAVAVLLVLAAHSLVLVPASPENTLRLARLWVGVDLFFCISGFVVAAVLMPKLDLALARRDGARERRQAIAGVLKAFFVRRAFRILPLSWLWLAIVAIGAATFNQLAGFGTLQGTLDAVPSILTYWYNIWLHFNRENLTLVGVYWSLSVEEQFYLLFPLLLVAVASPRWRLAVLLAIIAVQAPLARPVLSLLWLMRTDAIALGVCLYLFSRTPMHARLDPWIQRDASALRLVLAAGLVTLALVGFLAHPVAELIVRGFLKPTAVALFSAVLVFFASFNRDYFLPFAALDRPLGWLGTRSYGLYLAHLPAYVAARELWHRVAFSRGHVLDDRYTWEVAVTGIVALVVVTELLYRWVERPLREWGRRLAHRRWPAD